MNRNNFSRIALQTVVAIMAATIATQHAMADITTGLIGHWQLEETSGVEAQDASGNKHFGTLSGTTFSAASLSPGKVDDAAQFDGIDDSISVAVTRALQLTSQLTIAGWVKGDNWGTGVDVDIILRKGAENPNNYQLAIADGKVTLYLDDSDDKGYRGNTTLQTGVWYHVAATWDGSIVSVYVDGVLDNKPTSRSGKIGTDKRGLAIGGLPKSDLLDGALDDVRLYNRALAADDIVALYKLGVTFGLVGHWALDETSGTKVTDSSDQGNDGGMSRGFSFDASSEASCPLSGAALRFNGTNDFITVSNASSLQITDVITLAAWIKADTFGAGNNVDVIARKGGNNPNNYQLAIADGAATLFLDDSDSGGFRGDTLLETDRWYHIAATWDGSAVRIFVNGIQDHATPYRFSATLGTDTRALFIGGHNGAELSDSLSYPDRFDGILDDVRVYHQALSPAQVALLYGLLGYWRFDEAGFANQAADSSGHGRHADLFGDSSWVEGRVGNAISFDGVGDYAQTLTSFPPPATGSVVFWMKSAGIPSSEQAIFGVRDTWEVLHRTTGIVQFNVNGASGNDIISVSSVAGAWHHIVATFSSPDDTYEIYVDGQLDSSGSATMNDQKESFLSFGTRTGSSQYWEGKLDEMQIFNRRLCADEISKMFGDGALRGVRILKWVEIK